MEKTDFVKLLNEDLETEFRSIVQYVQHITIIKGAEYMSTVDELRAHVTQELNHTLVLAEQVEFLGGVPSTAVPEPPDTTDSRYHARARSRARNESAPALPRSLRASHRARAGRRR